MNAKRPATLTSVFRETIGTLFRHRAGGLAGEGAFFAVLSLPPLVFGLAGSIGYVLGVFGERTVDTVRTNLIEIARHALTERSVQDVIVPTLDAVLGRGRVDVVSIGFLIALWSGSRALHVVMQGISIMYEEERGIVRARLLSLLAYLIGLAVAVVVLPLVLAGPDLIRLLLPDELNPLTALYWPVVMVVSAALLSAFYHVARPGGRDWRLEVPGALMAMVLWVVGSVGLRLFFSLAIGGVSIYGPLAAPIVVLIWLYLVVFSLLVGAALNATLEARRRRALGGSVRVRGPETGASATAESGTEATTEPDEDTAAGSDRDAAETDSRPVGPAAVSGAEPDQPSGQQPEDIPEKKSDDGRGSTEI